MGGAKSSSNRSCFCSPNRDVQLDNWSAQKLWCLFFFLFPTHLLKAQKLSCSPTCISNVKEAVRWQVHGHGVKYYVHGPSWHASYAYAYAWLTAVKHSSVLRRYTPDIKGNLIYVLTCREQNRAGRLNSKLSGEKKPQRIMVMTEKTMKSFGMYS